MFIPIPGCIVIVILAVCVIGVLVLWLVGATHDLSTWRRVLNNSKDVLHKQLLDEESSCHRVLRLLIAVHQARHPNWKIESGGSFASWQGLADGLPQILHTDADILAVLDGAFPHKEIEAAEAAKE